MDILPPDAKNLRACLLCSLVKSVQQFRRNGCENCEQLLEMRDNIERVMECTSANFDGMVALLEPTDSWVAKWQRTDKFQRGLYAIQVNGRLPEDVVDSIESKGIKYAPRDGSAE